MEQQSGQSHSVIKREDPHANKILVSLFAVTTPLAVILTSEKLSTYSIKFLKEKYEDAFLLSIFVVPVMLSVCMYFSLHFLYWILNIWIINSFFAIHLLISRLKISGESKENSIKNVSVYQEWSFIAKQTIFDVT